MDLTKQYPRSVKDKIAGVVMLARTTDKAKAEASGNAGEYHYNCPMDQAVLGLLGINADEFLSTVKNAKDDQAIEAYVKPFVAKKSAADIEQFNTSFVGKEPEPGSEGEKYFLELRGQVAPDRTDVTTWADLLDLDEKRNVPKRTAVAH
jgi:hypothetical protein